MNPQSRLVVPLIACGLLAAFFVSSLGGSVAQDATPAASPGGAVEVPLRDVGGRDVGVATLSDTPQGLTLTVSASGLPAGEHGIHFHEAGICDPGGSAPFESAGAHFNPTAMAHGGLPAGGTPLAEQPRHAGDLGNITADSSGVARLTLLVPEITLGAGTYSLADGDGTALIIHEGVDDLVTDPSGNSGNRLVCGVVAAAQNAPAAAPATPAVEADADPSVASPAASPEASPVAAAGGGLPTEVTVTSVDIDFLEDQVTIAADTDTQFVLPNQGAGPHNFSIDELGVSVDIAPGETAEVTINAPAGVYEYYCNIPGHRQAGQVGTLTVQ